MAFARERFYEKFTLFPRLTRWVAAKEYVAVDFYDGNILWDAINERTVICDIDFYQKSPYVGAMGLWGYKQFPKAYETIVKCSKI
ncbi:MAG: hypothetical protein LBS84_12390 [Clostridiales bacterium]|nr:hypothetical protein [Clostridiales bacterium]